MAEPLRESALPTLRLLTCGSVDDGKSTLIGRLLYEQKLIFDDQLSALERDSKKHGTVGADIDFALLVDGLEAEREQGITIDVAYRYFATPRRSFIVADTPGHEQYTRNMATGASNADLAILLVDARKGLLTQTHRHAIIASLLGVRHVVLAVNKIDLVDYDEATFRRIVDAFDAFAAPLDFRSLVAIPISARVGDNISAPSPRTPWHDGPYLHRPSRTHRGRGRAARTRRSACRCNGSTARTWISAASPARSPAAGSSAAMRSSSLRRAATSAVTGILRAGEAAEEAEAGDAVTLTLADEVDVARGDVLAPPDGAAGGRRPVHRPSDLDEPRAAAARPFLSDEDRRAHRPGLGDRAQAPHRRRQFRQARRQDAGAQRGRLRQSRRSPRRSPTTLTRRTARPGPSS